MHDNNKFKNIFKEDTKFASKYEIDVINRYNIGYCRII